MSTKKPRKPSVFDNENIKQESQNNENINATEKTKQVAEENNNPSQDVESSFNEQPNTATPINDKNSVGDDFNPLEGEVKKRAYAQNFGAQTSVPEVDRVPEPNINNLPPPPPPTKDSSSPFITGGGGGSNSSGGGSSTSNPQPQPQQKLNPEMQQMSDKDAKAASTLLVDAILSAYKQVWGIGYEAIKVSEEQIVDWVMQDKISLDVKMAIQGGEELDLRQIYDMYNGQAKDALTVDLTTEDFVKVREAMIREFHKRGWGVTDMQYIIQHFVRDIGQRAITVYQLRQTISGFTKGVMAQYEEVKKLRQDMMNVKSKVEPSEPTKIKKEPTKQTKTDTKQTVQDAKDFIESYEIKKTTEKPSEVREVPFYSGNEDIQPQDNQEEKDVTEVENYEIINPKPEE